MYLLTDLKIMSLYDMYVNGSNFFKLYFLKQTNKK